MSAIEIRLGRCSLAIDLMLMNSELQNEVNGLTTVYHSINRGKSGRGIVKASHIMSEVVSDRDAYAPKRSDRKSVV